MKILITVHYVWYYTRPQFNHSNSSNIDFRPYFLAFDNYCQVKHEKTVYRGHTL